MIVLASLNIHKFTYDIFDHRIYNILNIVFKIPRYSLTSQVSTLFRNVVEFCKHFSLFDDALLQLETFKT